MLWNLLTNYIIPAYTISCILAVCYNYWLKGQGSNGIKWVECLNPVKHFNVLIGFIFYFLIPSHVFEQFVLRVYDDYCRPNCLLENKGRCVSCGCNTYAKMMSPLEEDSKGNWSKIIWNKKKYEEIRKKYPVKIEVKYG